MIGSESSGTSWVLLLAVGRDTQARSLQAQHGHFLALLVREDQVFAVSEPVSHTSSQIWLDPNLSAPFSTLSD